ncbi:hypothetical protein [Rhodanobacter sp. FW106-PBR-R2A-1-13]|uniref:hypothetical protein n=1 Tax=Rhodanobacter sp. FW106-PBR-R2A-1-13 TaxID=3454845 RepID=UPI0034E40066
MSLKEAWREAFPAESARKVVTYLLMSWTKTATRKVPDFTWAVGEPDLTQTLTDVLRDGSRAEGLSGAWGSEGTSADRDPVTLKKRKGFRTDITYYSDREYPKILSLTFEWKKLKADGNSRKAYWGPKGMGRFFDVGGYAHDAPFGLMVGIYESTAQLEHVSALKKAMNMDDAIGFLHYIPGGDGKHLRHPSVEMPGLAEFDTQHVRQSGGFETFTFSHLFVCFPG